MTTQYKEPRLGKSKNDSKCKFCGNTIHKFEECVIIPREKKVAHTPCYHKSGGKNLEQ
jgi:hypothetical protein